MTQPSNKVDYSKIEYTKDRYEVTRGPYNHLTESHVGYFRQLLDPQRVIIDDKSLEQHNVDWILQFKGNSRIVLKPINTEEVSKILHYCNENLLAVCPQGGKTGVSGASVPVFDEIIICAELMNKVISLDEKSGILVCEAGCVLDNLNQYLDSKNLIMPVDIGSKKFCQIGGNVSTNAGGFRFARFGSLHGNVLGLEVVKANGEILDCLKTLRKDNTGYHLKNMFIGAEGTLGFITKIALQCITKPMAVNVALLGIQSYENVLKTYKLAKEKLCEILSAAEFMDAEATQQVFQDYNLKSPIGNYPFYLIIETYGSNEKHDAEKISEFLECVQNEKLVLKGTIASDFSKRQEFWNIRESIHKMGKQRCYTFTYDLTLSLTDFYPIVQTMREHLGNKALLVYGFGHLGDANIHLHIEVPKYSKELQDDLDSYVYKKVVELKGSISAEHGLGFKNAKYLQLGRNKLYADTMKDIKKMMDPKGIMNPYKVIPS